MDTEKNFNQGIPQNGIQFSNSRVLSFPSYSSDKIRVLNLGNEAPDVLYVEDREFIVLEGDAMEGRFSGTTSGDVLQMYYEGWWEHTVAGQPG